ncbi:type II secretory pathway, ATPase PulE/Tfp pilus assembly pathway, ATPase PilB [Desulfitobacterium metallireducens DSM 15288]|uniref:Type II secretory pathway, ATPase PulE/Tfp pilus assembly pathway, ATPase PilB n=1 Tax=Desulfitobacterium metallireducens DSM 15288 TaxID=871968 RepID=W0EEC0_9FIRM|nr:type II secretory pathway, ATPase PulE/Tfp pilus assembly pathway, ATPase PilB [Desulfitobacterium metallireducens DSM 15288]
MSIKDWYNQKKQKPWECVELGVRERKEPYLGEGGFGKFLLDHSRIDSSQLSQALKSQQLSHERLGECMVREGFLEREEMLEALGSYLGVPWIKLTEVEIDPVMVKLIQEEMTRRYLLIPLKLQENRLQVAMADPGNLQVIDNIRVLTGYQIEPFLADQNEIEAAIRKYVTVENSVAQLASSQKDALNQEPSVFERMENLEDDAPTVRLVDSLLIEAVSLGASDVHWEPREDQFIVRYRIDGRLETRQKFPLEVARNVIARLKVMARMDVAEKRLPQDGRTELTVAGNWIDLRLASLPTVYGEKVVVRLLNPDTAQRTLQQLGMRIEVEEKMRLLLKQPHGIILVVGPTGSGKTTTLYALLRELASEKLNIVSIEDPVEYRLPGVVHVQVQPRIGLTFAKGLRAILRQDPDVIMIGEIRDEETARIAIAAALTGHLVLSTLHTNTAAEALTRLMDMGIEPYLLGGAIRGVLSQRLVRKLCEKCKEPHTLSKVERDSLGLSETFEEIFQAKGCPHCRGTGYSGRIGIHELLHYDSTIKNLVLARQSALELERAALSSGMIPLYQDGLDKVRKGLTTWEEVWSSSTGV